MTDSKSKPKGVNKTPTKVPSKKAKESKTESFTRIAKPRVEKVLKSLRILGNCGSRANYEYTQEQVEVMFSVIQTALNNAEGKFVRSKTEQESFDF